MSELSLWAQLSRAIAAVPCLCTENDACDPHELLDELYARVNGQVIDLYMA